MKGSTRIPDGNLDVLTNIDAKNRLDSLYILGVMFWLCGCSMQGVFRRKKKTKIAW